MGIHRFFIFFVGWINRLWRLGQRNHRAVREDVPEITNNLPDYNISDSFLLRLCEYMGKNMYYVTQGNSNNKLFASS